MKSTVAIPRKPRTGYISIALLIVTMAIAFVTLSMAVDLATGGVYLIYPIRDIIFEFL